VCEREKERKREREKEREIGINKSSFCRNCELGAKLKEEIEDMT